MTRPGEASDRSPRRATTPILDARSFRTAAELLAAAAAAKDGICVRAADGCLFTVAAQSPSADAEWKGSGDLQIPLAHPFPCGWCDYDLRGQQLSGSCPECGTPLALTVCQALEDRGHQLYPFLASVFGPGRSMVPGYGPDAVAFVIGALVYANAEASARSDRGTTSASEGIATADDLLRGVRAQIQDQFDGEQRARSWLLSSGLCASESFGRLTSALAQLGLVRLSPSLRLRDFDGLFTLDSLFEI